VRGLLWIGIALGLAAPLVGWHVTDHLESDDSFCISCHLDPETPLHQTKYRDFNGEPARNLAALHATGVDGGIRCIDCHGGASFPNKLRVKTVAGLDSLRWLVGAFDEPTHMRHPLWDEDCTQCHARIETRREDDFHAIQAHVGPGFEVRCVGCHTAHPTDGEPSLAFLQREPVAAVCTTCHEEL